MMNCVSFHAEERDGLNLLARTQLNLKNKQLMESVIMKQDSRWYN